MHRRHFLKSAGIFSTALATASTGCTHRKFYNPDQDIIMGGGRFRKGGEINHVLAITNLQQRDTLLIDTQFLPEQILIDPKNKKRLITFEKDGDNAAEIDLDNHEVNQQLRPETSSRFSGYAAFEAEGANLFTIESNADSTDGSIIVRDSKNFQALSTIPTYGKRPLSCKLIDQNLIAVMNRGDDSTAANITYIDIMSERRTDEITIAQEPVGVGAFAISDRGQLIVSAATEEENTVSRVSISDTDKNILVMTDPVALTGKLTGNAYAICIDEAHDIAAISHPQANLLTFWSISGQKLHKAMSVPNPRGIALTLDSTNYIVSFGIDTRSILIRTKDLVADRESVMQPIYASGDHIINWSYSLRRIMPGRIYA